MKYKRIDGVTYFEGNWTRPTHKVDNSYIPEVCILGCAVITFGVLIYFNILTI